MRRSEKEIKDMLDDVAANLQNNTRVAVAQRQRLVKLVEDRLDRGQQTVGLYLVEHHAYFVRLLSGLINQVRFAKIKEHAFGARRDERARSADE